MSARKMPKAAKTVSLTVRLPAHVASSLKSEARTIKSSISEVVRRRLISVGHDAKAQTDPLAEIADLIAPIAGMPSDVSSRMKHYLKETGYGRNRHR